MDRTREKLIEAAVDIVVEESGEELTVRSVAARAGVSVPTAYRHFPDREVLVQQMGEWINGKIAGFNVPTKIDEAAEWMRSIYLAFESNDKFMRAQLNTPSGRAVRASMRKVRNQVLADMVKASFPAATPTVQRRFAAIIQTLVNVPAWVSLHDYWGMSGAEAGHVISWAMEHLISELRRRPSALDFEVPAPTASPPAPTRPPRPARKRKTTAE